MSRRLIGALVFVLVGVLLAIVQPIEALPPLGHRVLMGLLIGMGLWIFQPGKLPFAVQPVGMGHAEWAEEPGLGAVLKRRPGALDQDSLEIVDDDDLITVMTLGERERLGVGRGVPVECLRSDSRPAFIIGRWEVERHADPFCFSNRGA